MMRGKVMRLDEDFWLKLLILCGFGTLGGLAKYLDYRDRENKRNPKSHIRLFSGLLLSSMALGLISAIPFGFLMLEFLPGLSPGILVAVAITTGAVGYGGLQTLWNVTIQVIANKHYGIEVREIEISDKPPKQKRNNHE